jgi:hypothetical protein
VLADARYWEERETEVVICRALRSNAKEEDIVLIE